MTSDLLHPFPLSLVLGFTFRAKTPVPEQERIWEELVNWLELRQLFVGGNASCAFVLVTGNGPPFATELRQWIATKSAIRHWRLSPARWDPIPSASEDLHNARVEALCNLQQHLVERMAQATQAMYYLKWKDPGLPLSPG